jgi:aminoglycoside 6'-N-acetyltransferase
MDGLTAGRPPVGASLLDGSADGKELAVSRCLELRPVTTADIDLVAKYMTSMDGTGPFQWFGFTTVDRLRNAHQENGLLGAEGGVLTVVEDGDAVGRVEWFKAAWGRADTATCWTIAIGLIPTARGRGIGRWAQCELVQYLFKHTRAERIQAYTDVANVAERRALEAARFTFEGVIRRGQWRDGDWHDLAL